MDLGNVVADLIGRVYPPAVLATSLAEGRGVTGLAGFLLGSVGAAVIFVAAVSKNFLKVNSALASLRRSASAKLRFGKASPVFLALYKKEWRRLFSSTIYATNTLVGEIMMLLLTVSLFAMKPEAMEKAMGIPGVEEYIRTLFPLVAAMLVALNSTTACSLSLEGKSRWIACSLPVKSIEIFRAKIALNLSVAVPVCLVSAVCYCIRFRPTVSMAVPAFFVPVVYSVFASVTGMFVNVKLPSYDWTHEKQAVKSSASVLVAMLAGMTASLPPFFAAMSLPLYRGYITWGAAAVVFAASLVIYRVLAREELYE